MALKTDIKLEILCGLDPAPQTFATKVASVCFWLQKNLHGQLGGRVLELCPSRPAGRLRAACPPLRSRSLGVEPTTTDRGALGAAGPGADLQGGLGRV